MSIFTNHISTGEGRRDGEFPVSTQTNRAKAPSPVERAGGEVKKQLKPLF